MTEMEIDTVKMRDCGKDIISLTGELNITIEAMFNRLSNMPINTKEWVGNSSLEFVRIANLDKIQYLELKKALYQYGKYLIDCADYLEKTINEVRRDI